MGQGGHSWFLNYFPTLPPLSFPMLPDSSEVEEEMVRSSVAVCTQKERSGKVYVMGTAGTGRWFPPGLRTVQMLVLRVNALVTGRTLCS